MFLKKPYIWISLFCILFSTSSRADSPPFFQFSGQAGIFYDAYGYSQENYENFRPRYPDHLARFSAHATLSAGKYFSMPFGIDITNQKSSYHLPNLPEERFIDYVQNPRNNISLNPSYKWAKAFLGTQTPSYSALTTGDIPIFGVGMEVDPGSFLFSFNYGKSQIGITPSPFENIAGAYEQWMTASRIGVGKPEGTKFVLNFVKVRDDIGSIEATGNTIQPKEGVTLSPILQIKLSDQWLFSTEVATSVLTNDLLGPEVPVDNELISSVEDIITVNGSSNADFSNITALEWKSDAATIGGEVRYIGPGFNSVGYRTMERDLIDYNLNTNFRFFNNKMIFSGSTGLRQNNLEETTMESTSRFIANVNLYAQISEVVSVNTSYSNFGFQNNLVFDTLRIEMIQNMFSIAPALQFDRTDVNHIINTGASYRFFDEFNMFEGETVSTVSNTYNLNYTLVFKSFPLSFGAMGMLLDNETPQNELNLYNVGVNARYRLFDKKLTPSFRFSYSGIKRNDETPDQRTRLKLKTEYKLTPKLDLRMGYTWSGYAYGSSRPDAVTNEHRFQVSLGQRF